MKKIKKIGVLSFGKFQGFIGALFGLLLGILYSFGGFMIDLLVSLGWITTQETPGLSWGTVLAFGALIGMPVIGGAIGFVFGLVEALVYNLIAPRIGGIKIEMK